MKKLFLISFIIVLAVGFVLGGCAEPAPTAPAPTTPAPTTPAPTTPAPQVFHLTMAAGEPDFDPVNSVVTLGWFNWLKKASGGRLEFTLLAGGAACPVGEEYDTCRSHIVDLSRCYYGLGLSGRFPLQEVTMLPLIFQDPGCRQVSMTASALYDKYPEMQALHPDVKVIAFHASGMSHIATVKKQVHTLDDLEGLIDIELGPWAAKAMTALGGSPVAVPHPEQFDVLSKGTVDGLNVNYSALEIHGYWEVVNYCTEVGLTIDPMIIIMNNDTWNSLPSDLQKLFTDSFWVLPEIFGYQFDKDTVTYKQQLQEQFAARGLPEIYVLPEAEKELWIQAVTPVHEEWIKEVAPTVGEAKARAILADAINFAQQYRYETTTFDKDAQTLHDWGAAGY